MLLPALLAMLESLLPLLATLLLRLPPLQLSVTLPLSPLFRRPSTLAQLPELLRIAGEDVKTDLSPVEMGQLLTAMAGTKLSTHQLPGRLFWHNDLSYWMPDGNSHYAGVESP